MKSFFRNVSVTLAAFALLAFSGAAGAQDVGVAKTFIEGRVASAIMAQLKCDWDNPRKSGDVTVLCEGQDPAKKVVIGTAPGNVKNVPILKTLGDNLLFFRAGGGANLLGTASCRDTKAFTSIEKVVAAGACKMAVSGGPELGYVTVFMKSAEVGDVKVFFSVMGVANPLPQEELEEFAKTLFNK